MEEDKRARPLHTFMGLKDSSQLLSALNTINVQI